jgi:hypothetical protein
MIIMSKSSTWTLIKSLMQFEFTSKVQIIQILKPTQSYHVWCSYMKNKPMIGKTNKNTQTTSYHIQLSFDHEIPHKKLREYSTNEFEPAKEIKSEPVTPSLPQKEIVTPSPQIPTPSNRFDMPSTYTKNPKPSSLEQFDQFQIVEKLQKENAQLLQCLVERETVDHHLHHDNVVLQEKVNYFHLLVDQMTTTNPNLRM